MQVLKIIINLTHHHKKSRSIGMVLHNSAACDEGETQTE